MKNILKKLSIAVLLFGNATQQSSAQVVSKGSSHINVGYEFPDYIQAFVSSTLIPLNTTGPFTISYQYAPWNKIAVGVQLGYLQGKTPELSVPNQTTGGSQFYQATYGAWTAMAKADYHYLTHNRLDLYSGLSLGVGFGSVKVIEDKKETNSFSADLFIWHLRPVGVRYMVTDNIGAFAEGGMFTTYFSAVVGISAKFGGSGSEHENHRHK